MSDNQGYEYDSSGNLTKDATDKRFVYDAENKQTSFGTNGSSTNGGSYFYDGDGKRVKKIVGTETTIFVYNASGQMVAEYSTTTPTNPTISYLTSDTLGSPRINTDAFGQVKARHDYMPFGEEIIGLGNRTSSNGYQDDDIRQKFTGQQRDNESGLDYFIARYYSSAHGRFTSTDPINITEERMQDPQQINLYAYARNNPMKYVDPNGEDTIETELYQYSFLIEKRGKDSKGREWVYQVRVNVEERREVRRDVTGNITHRGPLTSVTATANNTNNATNTLSNEQLKTVGNVTSAIVQEAEKQGVAKSVALAIGTRETFLGAEKREGASDTQMSDINPLQLTTDSGKQPTTDLKTNIRLSLEHYKERSSGYSLEAGLQRYGPGSNNPGGTGYGSDVAQISRNIKGQISPESSFNRTYYFYRRFAPYPSPGRTNIKRP
jgi:RHS repeat-associated protein